MKVFCRGHREDPVEFNLDKYGFVEFIVGGQKFHIKSLGSTLQVRCEGFGALKVLPKVALEVLPRVAIEVLLGVEH